MEKLSQKSLSFLAWWVVTEVQKYFSIASTERLNLEPYDFRFFRVEVDNDYVGIFINGENTGSEMIDIWFDFEHDKARIEIPSVYNLIRATRVIDFDMSIINDDDIQPDGSIDMEVYFTDALDRIPIWEAMPTPKTSNNPNRPPRVVGGPNNVW